MFFHLERDVAANMRTEFSSLWKLSGASDPVMCVKV
jgi:hypothetical protein